MKFYIFAYRLTNDQGDIFSVVYNGHNAFITGQAGTGKSFLVKEILKSLSITGKQCAIICSSGIGGSVYDDLHVTVTTVHTFYGLQTAELPWHLVVDRSISNEGVRERLKGVDCIVWDEASMSSRRIFELANYIHHLLASSDDLMKPFSGKQLIVVGEFLQMHSMKYQMHSMKDVYCLNLQYLRKCYLTNMN